MRDEIYSVLILGCVEEYCRYQADRSDIRRSIADGNYQGLTQMSWLLRKQQTKQRRGSGPTGRRWQPWLASAWNRQSTKQGLKVLAVVVGVVVIIYAWQSSERFLRGYISGKHTDQTPCLPQEVVLADAPHWLSNALEPLRQIVAKQIETDPMDPTCLHRVVRNLQDNPWVNQVNRVQRKASGQVWVYVNYREPVAVVEDDDGYHLVDGSGVRLPLSYKESELAYLGLPVLTGVSMPRPKKVGTLWVGNDLQAALALVRYLHDEPYMDQVAVFDVSRTDHFGRPHLVIRTRQGWLIRWGLAPHIDQVTEQRTKTKKRWLAGLFANPNLDSQGHIAFDLSGATIYAYQDDQTLSQHGFSYHLAGDTTH